MITQEERKACPRMMISIIHAEDEKRLDKVLDALHMPICYRCRGQGTAPSEILDIFGLSGTTRLITISVLPKYKVEKVFSVLSERMSFRKRGGGIAFTIPITGLQSPMLRMLNDDAKSGIQKRIEGEEAEMRGHSLYSVIWVSVVRGYSDDVIDVARAAGARGGTIIKGIRRGSEQVMQYLGFCMQAEQDFVMIVVQNEKKAEVMSAISKSCGLKTEAHGIVVSVPVDDVMGLE